jgi:ABC-type spermidine/putrescine transport system permease subunit I
MSESPEGRRRGVPAGREATWGLLAALAVAAPVLVGVAYAAAGAVGFVGPGAGSAGASRVWRVLSEGAVWAGAGWSLWVAAASTFLATTGAVVVAVSFRGWGRGDRWARALTILPLPIPHIAAAVGGVLVLGQSGLLARGAHALGWIASPGDMPALVYDTAGWGLILTLTWKELPFLGLVAFSVLAARGPALEEAARSLGARRLDVLRWVTLPLLLRGMLPGVVAVFAFVAGTYEATALMAPSDPLALPLLTMERYTASALAQRGDAYVLVLLGVGLAALAVVAHEAVRARGPEGHS